MRVFIEADSMTTKQLRALLAELSKIGKHQTATVGLNGPEKWTIRTPPLSPDEFATVTGNLIRFNGEPISEFLGRCHAA